MHLQIVAPDLAEVGIRSFNRRWVKLEGVVSLRRLFAVGAHPGPPCRQPRRWKCAHRGGTSRSRHGSRQCLRRRGSFCSWSERCCRSPRKRQPQHSIVSASWQRGCFTIIGCVLFRQRVGEHIPAYCCAVDASINVCRLRMSTYWCASRHFSPCVTSRISCQNGSTCYASG